MTAIKPIRLQLSRKKGFNLQAASRAINGLDAVNVARRKGSRWGNPFLVSTYGRTRAIRNFRNHIHGMVAIGARDLAELRGKNLACWCRLGEPCHADVLLEIANA